MEGPGSDISDSSASDSDSSTGSFIANDAPAASKVNLRGGKGKVSVSLDPAEGDTGGADGGGSDSDDSLRNELSLARAKSQRLKPRSGSASSAASDTSNASVGSNDGSSRSNTSASSTGSRGRRRRRSSSKQNAAPVPTPPIPTTGDSIRSTTASAGSNSARRPGRDADNVSVGSAADWSGRSAASTASKASNASGMSGTSNTSFDEASSRAGSARSAGSAVSNASSTSNTSFEGGSSRANSVRSVASNASGMSGTSNTSFEGGSSRAGSVRSNASGMSGTSNTSFEGGSSRRSVLDDDAEEAPDAGLYDDEDMAPETPPPPGSSRDGFTVRVPVASTMSDATGHYMGFDYHVDHTFISPTISRMGGAVAMQGWLQQSELFGWNKRYFVLKGELLVSFKNSKTSKPSGYLWLRGSNIGTPSRPRKEFCFDLQHTAKHRISFAVESAALRSMWMTRLTEACDTKVDPKHETEGTLMKRGGGDGGRQSWKKRHFVLSHGTLLYFANTKKVDLLGFIPVRGCKIKVADEKTQAARPHSFIVAHPDRRNFTLQARDEDEQGSWMRMLGLAAKGKPVK